MAEVVDWSPVDESNNSPPPVGAPEHHAPSATNNIMRAMMGAIRRWYDSVNTQLANFLPLTGGTVTGNAGFTGPLGIHIQGTWLDGDGSGNLIVRNVAGGDTAGAVWSVGYGAAYLFSDRDMASPAWLWYANAGNAIFGRAGATAIITVNWGGQVTVAGNLTATGNITATSGTLDANVVRGNYILSDGNIDATATLGAATIVSHGDISAARDITVGRNITAASGTVDAATVRGNYILSDGNIDATATLGAANIVSHGNINATGSIYAAINVDAEGTLQAALVQSLGAVTAANNITAGGNVVAAGSLTGAFITSTGGIHANGGISADVNIAADGNITAGGTVTGNTVTANSANATNITAININGTDVHGSGSLSTKDATGGQGYALFTLGSTSYLQFLAPSGNANRWEFNGTNGDVQYRSLNVVQWVMRRSSDTMCFNALGPVGGNGAYYNSSDRRFKEDIESDTCGLDAVLKLRPVSFRRIGQDYRETGFVAQELREVVPEAVRVVGIPLPDDTGGPEDENPTLGVDTTPIIAALVNAVKEMSGRIRTLEGAK